MQFVIFHGSFGTPQANWFAWLKEELIKIGQDVLVPAFPVDTWDRVTQLGPEHTSEIQNVINWTDTFEKEVLPNLKNNEPICFIGHSLAPVFILHMVEKFNLQLQTAIFVAPFLEHLGRSWQIDVVNKSFYKTDFDFEKLKKLIPVSFAIFSDNDPYVPEDKPLDFANKMNSKQIIIKGGQHFNEDAGFTSFPQLLELCKTRIS